MEIYQDFIPKTCIYCHRFLFDSDGSVYCQAGVDMDNCNGELFLLSNESATIAKNIYDMGFNSGKQLSLFDASRYKSVNTTWVPSTTTSNSVRTTGYVTFNGGTR